MRSAVWWGLAATIFAAGCGEGHVSVAPSSVPPDGGRGAAMDAAAAMPADAAVAAGADAGTPPADGGGGATVDAAVAADGGLASDGGVGPGDGGGASDGGVVSVDGGGADLGPPCPREPTVVVSQPTTGSIAADDSAVYYATGDSAAAAIWSQRLDGGAPRSLGTWYGTIPGSGLKPNPAHLAIDATDVFYGNSVAIVRLAKDGHARQLLVTGFPSDEFEAPQCLAVFAGWVYWCDPNSLSVKRIPVGGGAPRVVAHPSQHEGPTVSLAFAADDVYITSGTEILRVAGGGAGPVGVATAAVATDDHSRFTLGIAADERQIYFGFGFPQSGQAGTLQTAARRDGAPAGVLRTLDGEPHQIVSDGVDLYWSEFTFSGGAIWRMRKDGSGATRVVPFASSFVIVGDSLYVATRSGVERVCKQ